MECDRKMKKQHNGQCYWLNVHVDRKDKREMEYEVISVTNSTKVREEL